jgi:hypothetical protein
MAARAAVAEVQKHHSVWSLAELRFEVARALPPGASAEDVRQVADLAVTPGSVCGVLLVTAPEVADVSPLGTRRDGTSIYRPPNEARYTTTGQVDLEERILRQARREVPARVSEGMADGYYRGARYSGAIQLLVEPSGHRMAGQWVGYGRSFDVNTGPWQLDLVTADVSRESVRRHGE